MHSRREGRRTTLRRSQIRSASRGVWVVAGTFARSTCSALDFDFLIQLTRPRSIAINPLHALVTKPLPEVLGPLARWQSYDADLEGKVLWVYPWTLPSGVGFVLIVRMVGTLEIGGDNGRVRFTLPSALATVMASSAAWPMEGPAGRHHGRAAGWLMPMQGRVAAVGNDAFGLGLPAA